MQTANGSASPSFILQLTQQADGLAHPASSLGFLNKVLIDNIYVQEAIISARFAFEFLSVAMWCCVWLPLQNQVPLQNQIIANRRNNQIDINVESGYTPSSRNTTYASRSQAQSKRTHQRVTR